MLNRNNKRDVNFATALAEAENPEQYRAKRSSNTVLLVCMLVIGAVPIIYVMSRNENASIQKEIDRLNAYLEDPVNIETYNEKLRIQERIAEIKQYDEASLAFIGQLENSRRFSKEWITYYQGELDLATTGVGRVEQLDYAGRSLKLTCVSSLESDPRAFVEHLSNKVDAEGNLEFAKVEWTGFTRQADNEYKYDINITLWQEEVAE